VFNQQQWLLLPDTHYKTIHCVIWW